MIVEKDIVNGKEIEKHRSLSDELELAELRDFEAMFNRRYNIKDRNDLVYGNDVDFLKAWASVLSGLFMSAGSQNGRIGSYTNAKTSLNGLSQGDKLYDKVYRHYVKVKKNWILKLLVII